MSSLKYFVVDFSNYIKLLEQTRCYVVA